MSRAGKVTLKGASNLSRIGSRFCSGCTKHIIEAFGKGDHENVRCIDVNGVAEHRCQIARQQDGPAGSDVVIQLVINIYVVHRVQGGTRRRVRSLGIGGTGTSGKPIIPMKSKIRHSGPEGLLMGLYARRFQSVAAFALRATWQAVREYSCATRPRRPCRHRSAMERNPAAFSICVGIQTTAAEEQTLLCPGENGLSRLLNICRRRGPEPIVPTTTTFFAANLPEPAHQKITFILRGAAPVFLVRVIARFGADPDFVECRRLATDVVAALLIGVIPLRVFDDHFNVRINFFGRAKHAVLGDMHHERAMIIRPGVVGERIGFVTDGYQLRFSRGIALLALAIFQEKIVDHDFIENPRRIFEYQLQLHLRRFIGVTTGQRPPPCRRLANVGCRHTTRNEKAFRTKPIVRTRQRIAICLVGVANCFEINMRDAVGLAPTDRIVQAVRRRQRIANILSNEQGGEAMGSRRIVRDLRQTFLRGATNSRKERDERGDGQEVAHVRAFVRPVYCCRRTAFKPSLTSSVASRYDGSVMEHSHACHVCMAASQRSVIKKLKINYRKPMNLKKITAIIVALGISLCVTKSFAADIIAKPKLTEAQAGKLALKKVPHGKLGEGELEMENGILVYSFDISLPDSKSIVEVQVNAVTGSIVDVAVEGPAEQAKEAAEDKKAEAAEKGEKGEKGEKAEGKEKE